MLSLQYFNWLLFGHIDVDIKLTAISDHDRDWHTDNEV